MSFRLSSSLPFHTLSSLSLSKNNRSGSLSFGKECASYYGTTRKETRGKIRREIWKEARQEVGLLLPSNPPHYLFESHPFSDIVSCSPSSTSSLAYKEVWKNGNNFFEHNLYRLCNARRHPGRIDTFQRRDVLLFSFVRDPFSRFVSAYREVVFRYYRRSCRPGVSDKTKTRKRTRQAKTIPGFPSCSEMRNANQSSLVARKVLTYFFSGSHIPEELHFALQSAFLLSRPPYPSFYGRLERQEEEWKRLCRLPSPRKGLSSSCNPSVLLDTRVGVHKETSSDSMSHGKGLLHLLKTEPKWRRGIDVLLRMDRSCFSFPNPG